MPRPSRIFKISHESKQMAPQQVEAILKVPKPQTVKQIMTFLGMAGFSADWLECYAEKINPLRRIMKKLVVVS